MQRRHYHPVAQYLHWAVAALIVLQFLLARLAENAATPLQELALLANHRSVGITIFILALARLTWRVRNGAPGPLPLPAWQITASRVSHWTMYGLIMLLPVTGWLMSSASGNSVSWFNLVPLPDLVAADPGLKETLETIHGSLALLLFLVAVIHIAAALRHSLFEKNGAIARITSTGALLMFVAIGVAGIATLTRVGSGNVAEPYGAPGRGTVTAGTAALAAWDIDYESSYIRFVATQAGADFTGEWREWTADIRFDAENLDAGMFDVSVQAAAVETLDDERDRTLQDAEWFDVEGHPKVRYRARSFRLRPDGGFAANGSMTVKGSSTPVMLEFSVVQENGRLVLDGQAQLDRLALQVGIGEWADTRWIGQYVGVVVHVETK